MSVLLAIASRWIGNHRPREATCLSLFAVFVSVGAVSCGQPPTPAAPVISFVGPKQVHQQRETVTAKVHPALAHNQILQIWVRADDGEWYPCEGAKQDRSSKDWKAVCQFGSDKHPAADGTQFVLGAFYTTNAVNVEYLPDSVWYLLKTQQTEPVVFRRQH